MLRNFTAGFVHVWAIVRYVQNLLTSLNFNIQVQISPNKGVTMEDDSTSFSSFAGNVGAMAELGAEGRVLRREVQLPHPVHAQRTLSHRFQGRTNSVTKGKRFPLSLHLGENLEGQTHPSIDAVHMKVFARS